MIAKEYMIPGPGTLTSQLRMTEVLTLHKDKVLLYEHHHTEIEIGLYDSYGEFNYHLPVGDPFNTQLTAQLLDIRKEFCDRLPEYEPMVKVHLLAILIEITRHYNPQEQLAASPANEENLVCLEHAIQYIMTNLTSSLTLNDIARHAGLSRTYFSTIFKKMNGISVWDFITIKRIDLAIHYLTQTSKDITEIAGLCGFNSTTNFNYAFKKITSLSPGVYRKSI